MKDALTQEVETAERAVWEALRQGDAAADRALMQPEFLGVYPSGFASRDCHVAQLADGPSVMDYDLSQITVRRLAEDVALIAYHARFSRRDGGPEEQMYVSSIWEKTTEGWRNSFSMDTPAD